MKNMKGRKKNKIHSICIRDKNVMEHISAVTATSETKY